MGLLIYESDYLALHLGIGTVTGTYSL